jgi:23S rRNA pseudouridine1911/1915/1917 synthase
MEDGKKMNNILFEDNHIIVIEKKINVPVQEDESKDLDVANIIKDYLKKRYNKPGNVYLGIVHRLDRPVGGVMVFAKTSKASSRLSEQIRLRHFKKKYYAVIDGIVNEQGTFIDKLLKDQRTNMVVVDERGKEAKLDYMLINNRDNLSLVDIDLYTGRSHQIRVQFSSRGLPLYGDQRYNKSARVGEQIALYAYYLSFEHPVTKEKMEFTLDMPKTKPFNLF